MRSASRRTGRSAAFAAGIAIAITVALPQAAVAGALGWEDATLVYVNDVEHGETYRAHDVRMSLSGQYVRLADRLTEVRLAPGIPCEPDGSHAALCTRTQVADLAVVLGDQPDVFVNDTPVSSFVCGAGGGDRLVGGSANDFLGGGPGRDELAGGDGRDVLAVALPELCEAGDVAYPGEVLAGGGGADQIHGGPAGDVLEGGDGDDALRGYGGDDRVAGGAGGDNLVGFEGDDELAGEGGNDLVFGAAGNDRLEGGEGNDTLGATVSLDADGPLGASAKATLVELGDDVLDGGAGDDTLIAGPGESIVDFVDPLAAERRGPRDRTLQSAAPNGSDLLHGGPGRDEATYFNRSLPVRVTPDGLADDGSAGERDRVDADVEVVSGGAGEDVLFARPEGSFLFGDLAADLLVGDVGADVMRGGVTDTAADVLLGGGGDDDLGGGGGDDDLDGGSGRDALAGDDGEDLLRGAQDDDSLWGGTGADRLEGGAGADCLHGFVPASGDRPPGCPAPAGEPTPGGADGGDVLAGGDGVDRLAGGGGQDIADFSDARGPVLATLAGADPGAAVRRRRWADRDEIAPDVEGARGGKGADTLLGNPADNLLDGGPGADQLDGGRGADRLRGGPGRDLIVARDREIDELRCGTAKDLAVVDADDEIVALRVDVCELVDGGGAERTGDLARVLGRAGCPVQLRLPGVRRSFDLAVATVVPWGTRVQPGPCGVAIRPPGQRRGRAGRVRGSTFSLERGRRGAALTIVLRGGKPRARCVRGSRAELRRLSSTAARPLLVHGRYAEVRGGRAAWTLTDRCDGSRVRVQRGETLVFGGRRGGSAPLRAPRSRLVPRRAP